MPALFAGLSSFEQALQKAKTWDLPPAEAVEGSAPGLISGPAKKFSFEVENGRKKKESLRQALLPDTPKNFLLKREGC